MPTSNIATQEMKFDDDDKNYKLVHRRHEKRRNFDRRESKSELATHTTHDIRKLRNLDENSPIRLRQDNRRKRDRRSSGPKLLSISQIEKLRQKRDK